MIVRNNTITFYYGFYLPAGILMWSYSSERIFGTSTRIKSATTLIDSIIYTLSHAYTTRTYTNTHSTHAHIYTCTYEFLHTLYKYKFIHKTSVIIMFNVILFAYGLLKTRIKLFYKNSEANSLISYWYTCFCQLCVFC